jgi:ATP-binding cassette subfamily B protein
VLKEYKSLFPYIKKHISKYIFGILFLILTDGGQLIIPLIVREAINSIESGSFTLELILNKMFLLVFIALLIAVGRFGWRYFLHGASRSIERKLREDLFSHLLLLSSKFYGSSKTGDIMSRSTNDMNAIRMATGFALVAFTDGIFMLMAILIILFSRYPSIALITVLPMPILTVIILFFGRIVGERFKKVQEGFSRISEHVQESLSGIRVIKAFVQEKPFLNKFREINDNYKQRNMDLVRLWGLFFPIAMFIGGLTSLSLLRFGGEAVLTGTLTIGDFTAILSYLGMLIWPVMSTGFTVNIIQRGGASLKRINSIFGETPDIKNPDNPVLKIPSSRITIKNLTYAYPETKTPVLRDINFIIEPGETFGILGRTGSGKTTLLNLIPRLLDPPGSSIKIGGRDIRKYDLHTLRSIFGIVSQNTFLFSASIRDNIAFGLSDSVDNEALIKNVSEISTITRDLEYFPEGWETQVGEKGITLSGGQKQRVSISRALAVKPEILVFDDALSNVDTETEEKILKQVLEFRKGKTNIIISHRISTLEIADNIIVLEKGEITQQGSHGELIKQDGLYSEIYNLQKVEKESHIRK